MFHVNDASVASLAISGMVRRTHRWYSPNGRVSADEFVRTALLAGLTHRRRASPLYRSS
ncbi:hypothetical protein [Cupriavidus sp. 8B]